MASAKEVFQAATHPWSIARVIYRDLLHIHHPLRPDLEEHLQLAMAWLCRAQDATGHGGVAAAYSHLGRRWEPPYPETTGYLIPTFLRYCTQTNQPQYRERALRMADWLLAIQQADGSFPATDGSPCVFDTGMILEGLIAVARITRDFPCTAAADKAARWLLTVQDADGAWSRYDFYGAASTYHAKVGASLAQHGWWRKDAAATSGALKHLEWVMAHQDDDGWFRRAGFGGGESPWLHNVAYAIEGLLDAAIITGHPDALGAAHKAALRLLRMFEIRRSLPGILRPSWKTPSDTQCLPGEAQMSVIWLKLYFEMRDTRFLNSALKMNDKLRQAQHVGAPRDAEGALGGSLPFSRGYAAWRYPNWSAKFFCDALMLEAEALARL